MEIWMFNFLHVSESCSVMSAEHLCGLLSQLTAVLTQKQETLLGLFKLLVISDTKELEVYVVNLWPADALVLLLATI